MTWNHRVIKHKYVSNKEKHTYYAIHEVFYNDKGIPDSCTKEPIDVLGESVKEIEWQIDKMKKCLKKPVINYEYFEKLEKKKK